jgi:S1-C subfamily serine protease
LLSRRSRARRLWRRHHHLVWLFAGAVATFLGGVAFREPAHPPYASHAALQELATQVEALHRASPATRAYAVVLPAVVGVRGMAAASDDESALSSGTGVVISERGLVLTNLHVVQAAEIMTVTFANGLVSRAELIRVRPEHDLALLEVRDIPPGLVAASIAPARSLAPGDSVIAVGFPFGIGPSVTAGIVSGLGRQYRFPGAGEMATNLIQFDAAVNSGSSGGPLVSMNGDVVGIVTGLFDSGNEHAFSGVAFAVPIEDAVMAVDPPPF